MRRNKKSSVFDNYSLVNNNTPTFYPEYENEFSEELFNQQYYEGGLNKNTQNEQSQTDLGKQNYQSGRRSYDSKSRYGE